jgi:hypothetical protein
MRDYTVRDGDRALTFFGIELAFSSSAGSRGGRSRPIDDLRWTEMTVYRTIDDRYVLEMIGRSDVYHRAAGAGGCLYGTPSLVRFLDSDRRPCTTCKPPAAKDLDPDENISVELDRYTTRTVDTAADLVAACHSADNRGYRYLTDVARNVLNDATVKDAALSTAYFTEKIA